MKLLFSWLIQRKHLLPSILVAICFSLSFSQRFLLHNRIPLWGRLALVSSLAFVLALSLIPRLKKWSEAYQRQGWKSLFVVNLLFAGILIILFIILPYSFVPFRTYHSLHLVNTGNTDVLVRNILSPDDKPIPLTDVKTDGLISNEGFLRLPSNAFMEYTREATGGFSLEIARPTSTISFHLTWDGTQRVISLAPDSPETITIRLPGSSWGKPGLEGIVTGVVSTISDFLSMTFLLNFLWYFIRSLSHPGKLNYANRISYLADFIKSSLSSPVAIHWIVFGLAILFSVLSIAIDLPFFLPYGVVFLICPPALYLAFSLLIRDFSFTPPPWLIRHAFWAVLMVLAIAGMAAMLQYTQYGAGMSGDSTTYIEGAENLLAGKGYVSRIYAGAPKPITGFPPFYPMMLSALGLTGIHLPEVGRLFNVFLFGVNIFLVGTLVREITASTICGWLAAIFFLLAANMIYIHSWLMTEPLFFSLMLLSLITFYRYLQTEQRLLLVITSLLIGFSILTRLGGITLLATACLGILLFRNGKILTKITDTFILGMIGILPFALFMLRNYLVSQALVGERAFTILPFPYELVVTLESEVVNWFIPATFWQSASAEIAILPVFGLLVIIFVINMFTSRKVRLETPSFSKQSIILLMNIISALILIVLTTILTRMQATDYGIRRYLMPVYILTITWIISTLYLFAWKALPRLQYQVLLIIIVFPLLIMNYVQFNTMMDFSKFTFGYPDYRRHMPELEVYFRKITPSQRVFSNNCELVYFFTRHPCIGALPENAETFFGEFSEDDVLIIAAPDPTKFKTMTDRLTHWQGSTISVYSVEFYTLP